MPSLQEIAQRRPYLFAVVVFAAETAVAVPFVVLFRVLGLDVEPLRLVIPVAQSAFMIWVVRALGWFRKAGFTREVRALHLYWYPLVLAFVPVLLYGTIELSAGPLAFYSAALLFTGISEETLARGVMLPALLPRGTWPAVLFAAGFFGVSHLSNLFFASPSALEMVEIVVDNFGFAILYGAIFVRTGNIWPLIALHTIHDYLLLTSGTAGPFAVQALPSSLVLGLTGLNVAYGVLILARAPKSARHLERPPVE